MVKALNFCDFFSPKIYFYVIERHIKMKDILNIERHIKMKDILNNELYKTIYKEDNTAKKIDLLFKKIGINI